MVSGDSLKIRGKFIEREIIYVQWWVLWEGEMALILERWEMLIDISVDWLSIPEQEDLPLHILSYFSFCKEWHNLVIESIEVFLNNFE